MKVHVLEHDTAVADAIGAVLEVEEFRVYFYNDIEALFADGVVQPDDYVIACDFAETMSAYEFTHHLSHLPRGVRVLLMSNRRGRPAHELVERLGPKCSYIRKPFYPSALLTFLKRGGVYHQGDQPTHLLTSDPLSSDPASDDASFEVPGAAASQSR